MGHKISENFIMSPIKCYFDNNGKNWWCETINSLRNIFDSWAGEDLPSGILFRYFDDQSVMLIDISQIFDYEDCFPRSLWLTWYKRRGSTEQVWMLFDDEKPRMPTEDEVLKILEYYK